MQQQQSEFDFYINLTKPTLGLYVRKGQACRILQRPRRNSGNFPGMSGKASYRPRSSRNWRRTAMRFRSWAADIAARFRTERDQVSLLADSFLPSVFGALFSRLTWPSSASLPFRPW